MREEWWLGWYCLGVFGIRPEALAHVIVWVYLSRECSNVVLLTTLLVGFLVRGCVCLYDCVCVCVQEYALGLHSRTALRQYQLRCSVNLLCFSESTAALISLRFELSHLHCTESNN